MPASFVRSIARSADPQVTSQASFAWAARNWIGNLPEIAQSGKTGFLDEDGPEMKGDKVQLLRMPGDL